MPGQAVFDHPKVDVGAHCGSRAVRLNLSPDGSQDTSVCILLRPLDFHVLSGNQQREVLAGDLAERLSLFGRVDPVQPNLVLRVVSIQYSYRVTVGNLDNAVSRFPDYDLAPRMPPRKMLILYQKNRAAI